ncbi:GPW/gp25 family protein [uncultured Serinicoccus sp.]|uniref:GPW/gp25 family protein n=1 Tax=uncultured Serinicoccus sp. TaxID=735514 RepID=UPI00261C73EB|nr:GPW/gp25 family protein [uncultured Serinicoccus sp.]
MTTSPQRAYAPRHLAFPLRLDGRGRTERADDEQYLRGLVEQVLFTQPGERVNRPTFGSGVAGLVFAPSGDSLADSTQALVHGALQQWLGDLIAVERVSVSATEGRLDVTVVYRPLHRTTDQPRSLEVSGGVGG